MELSALKMSVLFRYMRITTNDSEFKRDKCSNLFSLAVLAILNWFVFNNV